MSVASRHHRWWLSNALAITIRKREDRYEILGPDGKEQNAEEVAEQYQQDPALARQIYNLWCHYAR